MVSAGRTKDRVLTGPALSISPALIPNAAENRKQKTESRPAPEESDLAAVFCRLGFREQLFKPRDFCKLVIKIPENEIREAWEINGTRQGCDNRVRMSQLGSWGWWFFSS